MKKTILSAVIAGIALTANAQEQGLSYSKFFDNWQVGVNAGGYSPTTTENFIGNTRFNFGAEIGKQISPGFRLGFEGTAYLNQNWDKGNFARKRNPLLIENTNLALVGTFNLSNIFGGYQGAPRTFEVEAFAAPGWFHGFEGESNKREYNFMTTKFGANFLFNLGANKAWAIKLSPSILYFVDTPSSDAINSLNVNYTWSQLNLGVVYRFKGSNGAHHITSVAARNQSELDELNNSLNSLRSQMNSKDEQLKAAQQRANQLEKELQDARNQKPVVKTVTQTNKTLESVVTFRQGKSSIDASQLPNVERIATYLNKYANSRVVIKGYASPEGNQDKNIQLANSRAQAVKDLLVKRYKIDANRISAQGNGIGDMFSEPDWNRVSIATIEENK